MKKQMLSLMSVLVMFSAQVASAGSGNGSHSEIPAYYDGELFTIQFVEFSDAAAEALLEHNKSINLIFVSDVSLPGGAPFIAVIDSVPGDEFNPLWLEVEIEFTAGHPPRQLFSDEEVEEAAASGEITLEVTDEVYWCPVVGKK
jgi:hypothetical protein